LPRILVDYIDKLKDAENLDEACKFLEEVYSKLSNVPHIKICQLLHLSHVIRPDLFIPVAHWRIYETICYIYDKRLSVEKDFECNTVIKEL